MMMLWPLAHFVIADTEHAAGPAPGRSRTDLRVAAAETGRHRRHRVIQRRTATFLIKRVTSAEAKSLTVAAITRT